MANQQEAATLSSAPVPHPALARRVAALAAAALVLATAAMPQGGGLRTNPTATVGGTIQVDVGTSDPTVQVTDPATGATQSFPVDPGKRVSIPVPAVPPGALLVVSVGRGLRARLVLVEIVSP